jgi:hypothetical protein
MGRPGSCCPNRRPERPSDRQPGRVAQGGAAVSDVVSAWCTTGQGSPCGARSSQVECGCEVQR